MYEWTSGTPSQAPPVLTPRGKRVRIGAYVALFLVAAVVGTAYPTRPTNPALVEGTRLAAMSPVGLTATEAAAWCHSHAPSGADTATVTTCTNLVAP